MTSRGVVSYTEGRERQMGKVSTTITVANNVDLADARRGMIPAARVRSAVLTNVMVDTGAMLLRLPRDVIERLGLTVLEEVAVMTALGPGTTRMYEGVRLEIEGRRANFECLEVPAGTPPLLGVLPLERLGLELDLKHQRLVLLPDSGPDNYLTIL